MSAIQRSLFSTEPTPWELDAGEQQMVATVVFPKGLDGTFDYIIPEALIDQLTVGMRVTVPLGRGNSLRQAYCVSVEARRVTGRKLKTVAEILDEISLLSPKMLELTRWMADHYLCPWGQVLEAVVPVAVRNQAGTRMVKLYQPAAEAPPPAEVDRLPRKQRKVMDTLLAAGRPLTMDELTQAAGCTAAPIHALVKKGWLETQVERRFSERPADATHLAESALELNSDQKRGLDEVLEALRSRTHRTILMHGVTGSGKTEVYLQAIREVIAYRRQAIVLVPEISLTPQTVERFRARFGCVAVLHSRLTDAQRHFQWQQIATGKVHVVIGARSAVFAPVPRLGLIVIDEEHESSFKQETTPRYHARDVAARRAEMEEVPLVLGSATPSLESWHGAESGAYHLVRLPYRISQRPMPVVEIIDLRDKRHRVGTRAAITRSLSDAVRAALDAGGQVILLLNRRGYSTHIQCPSCGFVLRCPHCDIALTHHRGEDLAICHYCDYTVEAPANCPQCRFEGIRYSGIGTQRVEAELRARFPDAPCLRMDTDTMRAPGSHEKALAAFRSGEVKILLGTQMIAKGLDFPQVTLVGVINADTALHLPDFRAAERTFQLVTQVAGRSGRGLQGGTVLVQTYNPEHPAIQAASRHDYERFAAGELPMRRLLRYPPFSRAVRFILRGLKAETVRMAAESLALKFREHCGGTDADGEGGPAPVRILGPAPAPIAKLRGKHRFHFQAMGPARTVYTAARAAVETFEAPEGVEWVVDVDPFDML